MSDTPAPEPRALPPGERVAVVHDWLNGMRGGEKVLEAILELFPGARIYTLFYDEDRLSERIRRHPVTTSFLQGWPGWRTHFRRYLPLFPRAIERLRIAGPVDLVISSSHCVAKGILAPRGVPHLSYIHAPMRYVWDLYDQYFGAGRADLAMRAAMQLVRPYLQRWDVRSSARVGQFLCNSRHVAGQIARLYRREAVVVNPPVDLDLFCASSDAAPPPRPDRPWLVASALVPYKRVELAILAVQKTGGRLVIVGRGPELARLRALAGPETEFRGWIDDAELAAAYRISRGFLFPGVEDFGIAPLEATASGLPVVAYAKGGALETVVEGTTGVFFAEQTVAALCEAMRRADDMAWDPVAMRRHAEGFSRAAFQARFSAAVGGFLAAQARSSG